MLGLHKKLILTFTLIVIFFFVAAPLSLYAGKCSDAFAKCLDNVSTSWWKGPLDFAECVADFAACMAHKF